MPEHPRPFGPALAAVVLSLLVYAVSLRGTFVYDDVVVARDDKRLVAPIQWAKFWTTDYWNGGIDQLYRPLVSTSYGVQKWMTGDQPMPFHLVNWLLHAAVAALVAEFTRRCAGLAPAYVAGLLFAVHPIHVEAVAQIVGRAELMCAMGIFGAMVLIARQSLSIGRMSAIFGCVVFAILSKEQGILLPLMLLAFIALNCRVRTRAFVPSSGTPGEGKGGGQGLEALPSPPPLPSPGVPEEGERRGVAHGYEVWQRPTEAKDRNRLKWFCVILIWIMAGYLLFREHFLRFGWDRSFLDWTLQPMVRCKGKDAWLMPIVLLGHYVQLMLFPIKLSPDYGSHVIGFIVHWSDPYFWCGAAAILLWIWAIIWSLRNRHGFVAFCLICMAISFGIISNWLSIIGVNMAERMAYLPSAFFLILISLALVRLPAIPRYTLLVILLGLSCLRSVTYAAKWNDELQFFKYSLAQQPKSCQLYVKVAELMDQRGDRHGAEAVLLDGVHRMPDCWTLWNQLGIVAMDDGRLDDAHRYLLHAIDLDGRAIFSMQRWAAMRERQPRRHEDTKAEKLPRMNTDGHR